MGRDNLAGARPYYRSFFIGH